MERRGVGEEWERSGRKRTYMSIHHIVFDQLNTPFTAQEPSDVCHTPVEA